MSHTRHTYWQTKYHHRASAGDAGVKSSLAVVPHPPTRLSANLNRYFVWNFRLCESPSMQDYRVHKVLLDGCENHQTDSQNQDAKEASRLDRERTTLGDPSTLNGLPRTAPHPSSLPDQSRVR